MIAATFAVTGPSWPRRRTAAAGDAVPMSAKPLVSILIPAYNAGQWIGDTIRSALAQTWPRKEIIVVDDGSKDNTVWVARRFEAAGVKVAVKANEGAAATRNAALALSRGDYIQWLDADDLISPEKIELQLKALPDDDDGLTLLSSPWGYFAYRPERARFTPNSLWNDLPPVEWLLRKMSGNLHMQTATWLTSRALTNIAGPWDTRMLSDDDGEYFCRILLASRGVRFVPEGRVYYRSLPSSKLSFVGKSDRKMDALLLSMKLHIQYLRSMETSSRVDQACLAYIRNWSAVFDPAREDVFRELRAMTEKLGGTLEPPRLRWKFSWMQPFVGRTAAWNAQLVLPRYKARLLCSWDRMMHHYLGGHSRMR
jgi:glycosyltransferase involved in cell wall biosynthesis